MDERAKTLTDAAKLAGKLHRMSLPMLPKQAAVLLGVDVRTINNWVHSRRLGIRVGNSWLVDFQALLDSASGNDGRDLID